MRLIAILVILILPMSACSTARVSGSCPALAPPPETAIAALQQASDSATDAWVVDLSRHYDKLEICAGR